MLRLLDGIDALKRTPDRVAALVRKRLYLTAVRALLAAQKTADGEDYAAVGALVDVRAALAEARSALHETIVEDLHRYLYLRSAPCEELVLGAMSTTGGDDSGFPSSNGAHFETYTTLTSLSPASTASTALSPASPNMQPHRLGTAGRPSTAHSKTPQHRRMRSDTSAVQARKMRTDGAAGSLWSAVAADVLAAAKEDAVVLEEDGDANPEEDPLKHIQLMVAALDSRFRKWFSF
jgi:hypothetical protein